MDQKAGKFKVRDLKSAKEGDRLIEWAESRMPVLMALKDKYSKSNSGRNYPNHFPIYSAVYHFIIVCNPTCNCKTN